MSAHVVPFHWLAASARHAVVVRDVRRKRGRDQRFEARGDPHVVPFHWLAASAMGGGAAYLRLMDSCITHLKDQGPSRTCNESKEEENSHR